MKARILFLCLLLSFAFARVDFEQLSFSAQQFRDSSKLETLCSAPASGSFWCDDLSAQLTLIPTKGTDFFFNEAGELLAAYAKQQKGQNFVTKEGYRHGVDNGQNLIPMDAVVPGAAVLVDGEYLEPENVVSSWEQLSETEFKGAFAFDLGDIAVEKTVIVSNISHTLGISVVASRAEESTLEGEASTDNTDDAGGSTEPEGGTVIQLAVPGIAKAGQPLVKLGQGENVSVNPISQPTPDPAYLSFQTAKGRGNAIVLRPGSDNLEGQYLGDNVIALQAGLAPEAGSRLSFAVDQYVGPNELVRFFQEGYKDLPGLFNPNILGQVSLGVLWILQRIHDVVGNWGLSIVVLTLLFRVLIWPLISTQTRSMYGMQQLQPKLQELQKKYKDDREKLTQKTMELYREAGVNPAGGCLPIVLQMPLFIILWRVFANFEFNEGFLWIPDLGQADPFYILPLLYVGIIFAQSYFMAQGNKQSLQQQLLINAVFIIFIINFPAGVTLYWVVSMLVQVFQYWLIQRSRSATPAKAT